MIAAAIYIEVPIDLIPFHDWSIKSFRCHDGDSDHLGNDTEKRDLLPCGLDFI